MDVSHQAPGIHLRFYGGGHNKKDQTLLAKIGNTEVFVSGWRLRRIVAGASAPRKGASPRRGVP